MLRLSWIAAIFVLATAVSGCDLFGDSAEKIAAARDADGRAIGGACRHANRAIEDCYAMNKKADRAAVFAGWRDMNDYMRENKIEAVLPQGSPAPTTRPAKGDKAEKPTEKSSEKSPPREEAASPDAGGEVIERKPAKATPKSKDAEH